jgi:cell pole-organizing protein PopZ
MEEILASIRRIIADDEAKPAAAEKPASPAAARPEAPARPSVMKDIPPSAIAPAAKPAAPKPAPPPPPPAPEPVVSNNQDDIDAMRL